MSLNSKASAALRRELAKCFPERSPDDAGHARLADALTKPTHTSGPWVVQIENTSGTRNYNIRTEAPHNPAGGLGKHVATCNANLEAKGESNARLIAAAPDLLEALKALCDAMENGTIEVLRYGTAGDAMFSAARAAIARATGGAK
jgi:hypothetical protein